MNSLNSSVVNKSAKKIIPKAPPKRRAVPTESTELSPPAAKRQRVDDSNVAHPSSPPRSLRSSTRLQQAISHGTGPSVNARQSITETSSVSDSQPNNSTTEQAIGEQTAPQTAPATTESLGTTKLGQHGSYQATLSSPNRRQPGREATLLAETGTRGTRSTRGRLHQSTHDTEETTSIGSATVQGQNLPQNTSNVRTTRAIAVHEKKTRSSKQPRARRNRQTSNQNSIAVESVSSESRTPQKSESRRSSRRVRNRAAATRQRAHKGLETMHDNAGDTESANESNFDGESPDRQQSARPRTENDLESTAEYDESNAEDSETAAASMDEGTRNRGGTPDSAEDHQIDPAQVTMSDLTRNSRYGKKSKLAAAMRKIDWAAVKRRKMEEAMRVAEAPDENEGTGLLEQGGHSNLDDGAGDRPAEFPGEPPEGPQIRLVNGTIMFADSSLVVDRNAQATAEAEADAEQHGNYEESDLSNLVNTATWVNSTRRDRTERLPRVKSDSWREKETNAFYDALRMFGTDFYIISKMFPGKTRRQIKMKFVREEHQDPERIKSALVKETVPMDLAHYAEATGREEGYFKDPKAFEQELELEKETQREQLEREKAEQDALMRKKQEAAKAKQAKAKVGKTKLHKGAENQRVGAANKDGPSGSRTTSAMQTADDVAGDIIMDTVEREPAMT